MSEDGKSYFRHRTEQELVAAERAGSQIAADIHRSLAARMLALAEGSPVSTLEDIGCCPARGPAAGLKRAV